MKNKNRILHKISKILQKLCIWALLLIAPVYFVFSLSISLNFFQREREIQAKAIMTEKTIPVLRGLIEHGDFSETEKTRLLSLCDVSEALTSTHIETQESEKYQALRFIVVGNLNFAGCLLLFEGIIIGVCTKNKKHKTTEEKTITESKHRTKRNCEQVPREIDKNKRRPSNKVLLEFLQDAFPGLRGMCPEFPDTGYTKEYIREKMDGFLELLTRPDYGTDELLALERSRLPRLSARQIWCSTAVSGNCRSGHIGAAIHEFMDCVDNYGEPRRNERKISPDEHVLYYGLATAILLTIAV